MLPSAVMPPINLAAAERIADALFAPDAPHGLSLALVIRQGGEVLLERYGHQPDTVFGPGAPVTADTTLISWSMAKSITHAAVGVLVGEGRLRLEAPAPVPSWQGTEKEAITLQQLLEMRSGLEFVEDYVDAGGRQNRGRCERLRRDRRVGSHLTPDEPPHNHCCRQRCPLQQTRSISRSAAPPSDD